MQAISMSKKFYISGRVLDRKTQHPISELCVEVWDRDQIYNDLVGSATTDAKGEFHLTFDQAYFEELFLDRHPDLFFKVFQAGTLLKSTEDSVLWNVEAGETLIQIEVDVPVRNQFVIEGQLKSLGEINFREADLAVHAFVTGKAIAQTKVDDQGRYRLTFEAIMRPSATELRVLPAKLSAYSDRIPTLKKNLSASRYVVKERAYYISYDLHIPLDYVRRLLAVTKT
jgi:hypothetical protein